MNNFLEALNRPADAYRRQNRAITWLFVAATIIIVTILDPILHYFSNPLEQHAMELGLRTPII